MSSAEVTVENSSPMKSTSSTSCNSLSLNILVTEDAERKVKIGLPDEATSTKTPQQQQEQQTSTTKEEVAEDKEEIKEVVVEENQQEQSLKGSEKNRKLVQEMEEKYSAKENIKQKQREAKNNNYRGSYNRGRFGRFQPPQQQNRGRNDQIGRRDVRTRPGPRRGDDRNWNRSFARGDPPVRNWNNDNLSYRNEPGRKPWSNIFYNSNNNNNSKRGGRRDWNNPFYNQDRENWNNPSSSPYWGGEGYRGWNNSSSYRRGGPPKQWNGQQRRQAKNQAMNEKQPTMQTAHEAVSAVQLDVNTNKPVTTTESADHQQQISQTSGQSTTVKA